MNIKQALTWSIKKLISSNIDSASLDAELLLSLALKESKEFIYTHSDYELTKGEQKKFGKLINKRFKNMPVAYLIGHKEFYGHKFFVNKNVLIPRPQSEVIVDNALKIMTNKFLIRDTRYVICDMGTGSGCLIISLAKELQKLKMIDNVELLATDISKKALKVAQKNAKLHQVDKYITFLKGDLLKPLKNKRIDLIITNLPYLTEADVKNEPSIKKEPRKALIGNYSKFFDQVNQLNPRPLVVYEDKDGVKVK